MAFEGRKKKIEGKGGEGIEFFLGEGRRKREEGEGRRGRRKEKGGRKGRRRKGGEGERREEGKFVRDRTFLDFFLYDSSSSDHLWLKPINGRTVYMLGALSLE